MIGGVSRVSVCWNSGLLPLKCAIGLINDSTRLFSIFGFYWILFLFFGIF